MDSSGSDQSLIRVRDWLGGNAAQRVISHRLRAVVAIGAFCLGQILPVPAAALGIGEPRTLSKLFEPLQVDIPIDAESLDDSDLRVRLMVVDDHDDSEVLSTNGLRQSLWTDAKGQRFLRVRSGAAVREPMLTLHVDIAGTGVQVRRDLTLLFDPPDHAGDALAATSVPVDAAAAADRTPLAGMLVAAVSTEEFASAAPPPEPVKTPRVSRPRPAHRRTAVAPAIVAGEAWRRYGPVRPGETLETIAGATRASPNVPVATMALLLRWLNPLAFASGAELPRVGATLKYPDPALLAAQIAAIRPAAAENASLAPANAPATPKLVSLHLTTGLSSESLRLVAFTNAERPRASTTPAEKPVAVTPVADAVQIAATAAATGAPAAVQNAQQAFANAGAAPAIETIPVGIVVSALMLTAFMLGMLIKALKKTPAHTPRASFPRQSEMSPTLADDSARRLSLPLSTLLPDHEQLSSYRRESNPAMTQERRAEPKARPAHGLDAAFETRPDWHPDQFDLLQSPDDDAVLSDPFGDIDAASPHADSHDEDAQYRARTRRSNTGDT